MSRTFSRLLPIFLLFFLLQSCGGSESSNSTSKEESAIGLSNPGPSDPAPSDPAPSNTVQKIEITDVGGKLVGTIDLSGSNPKVKTEAGEFQSKIKGEKRKYSNEKGLVYAIKYKSDGFKLRTEAGQLIWKIKHSQEKIKVSDNEENLNPYEIKPKEKGRVKLKRNGEELGSARLRAAENKIEVGAGPLSYDLATTEFHMAFGVLAIQEINLHQRLIIVAELIDRGF